MVPSIHKADKKELINKIHNFTHTARKTTPQHQEGETAIVPSTFGFLPHKGASRFC
jgi:hypothetical protein